MYFALNELLNFAFNPETKMAYLKKCRKLVQKTGNIVSLKMILMLLMKNNVIRSLVYRANNVKSNYAIMRCLNLLKSADLSKKTVKMQTLTPNIPQGQRVRTLKGGGGGVGALPGASLTSWCHLPLPVFLKALEVLMA